MAGYREKKIQNVQIIKLVSNKIRTYRRILISDMALNTFNFAIQGKHLFPRTGFNSKYH